MNKTITLSIAVLSVVALFAAPSRAENDFDFVKKLMNQGYGDLAERFLLDLKTNGDTNGLVAHARRR